LRLLFLNTKQKNENRCKISYMLTVQDYDCGITEKARGKSEEQAQLKGAARMLLPISQESEG